MSKNNNEERKCKICGKTIVGKNKTGICSACKKKAGDKSVIVTSFLVLIGGAIWAGVKALAKGLEFEPPIIPLFVSKTAFYLPKAAAWPR